MVNPKSQKSFEAYSQALTEAVGQGKMVRVESQSNKKTKKGKK